MTFLLHDFSHCFIKGWLFISIKKLASKNFKFKSQPLKKLVEPVGSFPCSGNRIRGDQVIVIKLSMYISQLIRVCDDIFFPLLESIGVDD